MRFDGRKVCLDLLQAGQRRRRCGYFFCCCDAIFCGGMDVTPARRRLPLPDYVDIDESAQAIVLAKIAASVFVASGSIAVFATAHEGLMNVVCLPFDQRRSASAPLR